MVCDIIFKRIMQGDEATFEKFTKENYLSFCAVATRYVANIQEAEDIVQDVLIRLWEKRQNYHDIECLKSFVYTMIRNQALNFIRGQKRSARRLQNYPEEEGSSFLNIIIEEESSRLLLDAINSLAPQSSAIIKLSLQGVRNEEIARERSISENTVKVLKYRALKRLGILLRHRMFNILVFCI